VARLIKMLQFWRTIVVLPNMKCMVPYDARDKVTLESGDKECLGNL